MGQIHLQKRDGVAVLVIDAVEVKNGLTPEMGLQLAAHCDDIDDDPEIGAAVVQGAGGTFCSGADRRRWQPGVDQADDLTYRESGAVYGAFMRVGALQVPTIAAVRGAAVGAGINLMLATDLRIVATDARILAGFLRIGLHPGGGFFTIAGRTAGREATSAMGLFNEEVDGARAEQIGMAWRAVPDEEVEGLAFELASRPAQDPALSRQAVRSFRTELGPPGIGWEAALHFERATQMWSQRRRNSS